MGNLFSLFNFALLAHVTSDGTPAEIGGSRYAMTERGKTLRQLTAEEYEVAERRYRKTTGQVLTGAMLLFYRAAVLFFVPVKARPSPPRR